MAMSHAGSQELQEFLIDHVGDTIGVLKDDGVVEGKLISMLKSGNHVMAHVDTDHWVIVPGEIVIAFVTKFRLYGFWLAEGLFAKFLSILENTGDRLPNSQRSGCDMTAA